jgi:hypothetical protein
VFYPNTIVPIRIRITGIAYPIRIKIFPTGIKIKRAVVSCIRFPIIVIIRVTDIADIIKIVVCLFVCMFITIYVCPGGYRIVFIYAVVDTIVEPIAVGIRVLGSVLL